MKQILKTGIFAAISLNPNLKFAPDKGGDSGPGEPEPPQSFELKPIAPITERLYVEIKKLVIDANTQPRVSIDDSVVQEYAEIIKVAKKAEQPNPFDALPEDKLPQVFRDSTGRCVLADGFHRFGGHKLAHEKEMLCAIREGDARDALIFSLGTNQEHGVRRSNRDKQRAVRTAVHDPELSQLPDAEIARICGVSGTMVGSMRPAKAPAVKMVKRGGKTVPMDTSAIGKKGKKGEKATAAAAKKADKAAAKAAKTGSKTDGAKASVPPAENKQVELDKLLGEVVDHVGSAEGGKLRAAVLDGSLDLTMKDLRELIGIDAKKAKALLPLVTGGPRMKPGKAFDFVHEPLSEKIQTELHNKALGSSGGKFVFEGDGFTITCKIGKPE